MALPEASVPQEVGGRQGPRPNIVFILADDLGYGDLGCYGQKKIKTPRLDQMAREGIRFTSHYAGFTVCSPSRCALMTGKHMGHAAVKGNGGRLRASDVTVAMLLKKAGYKTCMIGKWGLVGRPGHPGSPNNKGFDHWFGFDNQGFAHFYYPEFLWRNDQKVLYPKNHNLRINGEYRKGAGTYSHDELTTESLGWIQQNKDHPFFLYLPYCIPHAELTVPEDSMAPYLKLNWPEKSKLVNKGNNGGGGYGSQYKAGYCGQSHPNAAYAGMISRMDRSIGKILDKLDELKLTDNTLVIFSSDNGPSPEGGQDVEFFNSNGPLSGGKRSMQEGGIRVPLIAKWPGKIRPGTLSDHPSAFWDFLPTACEVAGVEPPKNIDGISYLPELLGKTEAQRKHEYMYWIWAVRVGKWKLHPAGKDKYRLYDLENDIAEKHDVADKYPEVVTRCSKYFQIAKKPLSPKTSSKTSKASPKAAPAASPKTTVAAKPNDPEPSLRLPKVRITELKPLKATTGYGSLGIGRSAGGRPLSLSGKIYKDGIGMHANGELVYACNPGWTAFVATVGLDDSQRSDPRASIVCQVIAEDAAGKKQVLAKSSALKSGKQVQHNFDVRLPPGCVKLHLVVDDAGDGIHCDHADWVDFFDRLPDGRTGADYEDTQMGLKVRDNLCRIGAKHQIQLVFHGCAIPSGERRRWPHLVGTEAIKGQEGGPNPKSDNPKSDNCIAYIRNPLGSVDWSPVGFGKAGKTDAYQLATSVVFETGLLILPSLHRVYLNHPSKDFLKRVPAAWDETKLIDGYPGSHTVIAPVE